MLSNAGVIYRQLREIAEHGLEAAEEPPGARARLQEFHDVMAFIERRGAPRDRPVPRRARRPQERSVGVTARNGQEPAIHRQKGQA